MNREEALLHRLEYAKSELKRKQDSIRAYVNSNDIDLMSFERNLILELLYMIDLKARISSIEVSLQIPKQTEEE